MFFITFDEFYGVNEYNSFINAARNNGVEIREWINARPPYNWYLEIDPKDFPRFLDFEIATSQQEKWMIKKIDPLVHADEYLLLRRETDSPNKFTKFVRNDYLTEVQEKSGITLFRYKNRQELQDLTRRVPELRDTKIYMLGKIRGWNMAVTTNKFIEGHIISDYVLYSEYNPAVTRKIEELEAYINWNVIKADKISTKNFQTPYVINGKYIPIKKSS